MTALAATKRPSGAIRPEGSLTSYDQAQETPSGRVLLIRFSYTQDGKKRINGRLVSPLTQVETSF